MLLQLQFYYSRIIIFVNLVLGFSFSASIFYGLLREGDTRVIPSNLNLTDFDSNSQNLLGNQRLSFIPRPGPDPRFPNISTSSSTTKSTNYDRFLTLIMYNNGTAIPIHQAVKDSNSNISTKPTPTPTTKTSNNIVKTDKPITIQLYKATSASATTGSNNVNNITSQTTQSVLISSNNTESDEETDERLFTGLLKSDSDSDARNESILNLDLDASSFPHSATGEKSTQSQNPPLLLLPLPSTTLFSIINELDLRDAQTKIPPNSPTDEVQQQQQLSRSRQPSPSVITIAKKKRQFHNVSSKLTSALRLPGQNLSRFRLQKRRVLPRSELKAKPKGTVLTSEISKCQNAQCDRDESDSFLNESEPKPKSKLKLKSQAKVISTSTKVYTTNKSFNRANANGDGHRETRRNRTEGIKSRSKRQVEFNMHFINKDAKFLEDHQHFHSTCAKLTAKEETTKNPLQCYQCAAYVTDQEPRCDAALWVHLRLSEKQDLRIRCPQNKGHYCAKTVSWDGNSRAKTVRGCYGPGPVMVKPGKHIKLREGCTSFNDGGYVTTACFCKTDLCNGSPPVQVPVLVPWRRGGGAESIISLLIVCWAFLLYGVCYSFISR